jgi:hypothetical protein
MRTDDTRDIAIRTEARVENVENKVDKAIEVITSLKADFHERKGMDKLSGILWGISGGTLSVFASKLITWAVNSPLK